MGKRSNFERNERDFYPTPYEAVVPLFPHLYPTTFAEPCAGDGSLIRHLLSDASPLFGCTHASDIEPQGKGIEQRDALEYKNYFGANLIITNPPWDRKILHPMITHFRKLRPTWLLFDADWSFTKQSSEFMPYCSDIVAVGRVKWIPDSKSTGKDNCAWYKFVDTETETKFHGR